MFFLCKKETEMAITDRLLEKLKLIDSKKNSMRNVILTLATEWKDLDELLDSTERCVQGTHDELCIRENNVESNLESVRESNEELESIREVVESRAEELEMREKEFLSFQQMQIEELTLKHKQLETMHRSVDERIKETELREEMLNEQYESLEALLEKLKSEKEQLEHIQMSIGQRFEEIILKETYFEVRARELDSIQNWIDRRAKELDMKEEQIDDRANELELEEVLIRKVNEERRKELELKEKEIHSAQKLNEERSEKLDSNEKQLDAVQKYINESFKDFHSKNKQLKLDRKLFEEHCKELELKEKQLEEHCKEVELRQKQFVNTSVRSRVKVEQVEDMMPVDKVEIQFNFTMDGRSLQSFLNEWSLDDKSMASEVYRVLRLSLDPARLVLDAMEGFYPPHLKKGDVGFKEDIVRRSCIVLLEQLMKISPLITPRVKEDALKLAEEWKAKMRAVPANYLEVLGFFQLLASYKLASGFDADELLKLFAVVVEHNQAPDLCRVLGLTEKVPDFIKRLIQRDLYMDAIKYICGFSLVDEFPPTPLLERYLSRAKEAAKNVHKEGSKRGNFLHAQDKATRKEVAALNTVINCIELHRLESQYSPENLKACIEELSVQQRSVAPAPAAKGQLREEADKRSSIQSLALVAQPQELDGGKRIAPGLDHDSDTAPQQCSAKKIAAKGPLREEVDKKSAMQSLASVAQPQEQNERKLFASSLENDYNTPPQQDSAKKIAAKGQMQEEADKRSAMQSLALVALPQEQNGRKRFAPSLDHDSNNPPQQCSGHVAQPQEQDGMKRFAPGLDHGFNTPPQQHSAKKIAAKGQLREEADKRSAMQSLASVAQPQEQNGRKRFGPSPDHDSNTLPQQPFAKRICQDPVSMVHPIQSMQQPYQYPPGVFTAETAPYCTTYYSHSSLGASGPVPTMNMSPIRSEYGSGTPARRGFLPFGLVGSKYGFVPNSNDKPYTVAGTPHYSLS